MFSDNPTQRIDYPILEFLDFYSIGISRNGSFLPLERFVAMIHESQLNS